MIDLKQHLENSAPVVNVVAAHLTDLANEAQIALNSNVVILALGLLFAGHAKFAGLTEEQAMLIVKSYYDASGRLYSPPKSGLGKD